MRSRETGVRLQKNDINNQTLSLRADMHTINQCVVNSFADSDRRVQRQNGGADGTDGGGGGFRFARDHVRRYTR
jgi:hypothetical protein